jgi:hypothetical protein
MEGSGDSDVRERRRGETRVAGRIAIARGLVWEQGLQRRATGAMIGRSGVLRCHRGSLWGAD